MPLLLTCPCKQKLKVSDDKRGKNIKCSACQRILKIPERKTETKTDDSLWGTLPEAQSIQPNTFGNNYNALKPSKTLARKKAKGASGRNFVLLLSGLGVCIALAGVAGMAFWLNRDSSTAKVGEISVSPESVVTSNPGTTSNSNVETEFSQNNETDEVGGFVPSIPHAIVKWPKPVLENAAFDILKFVEAPPANENAAPLYLNALFEFSSELEACFVGAPNLADRLNAVKERVKLSKVFTKSYSAESAAEWKNTLKLYDEGFGKMVRSQKRPKCMFRSDFFIRGFSKLWAGTSAFGKIANYRSTVNLRDGDFSTPLQSVEMILRLSRDVRKPNSTQAALMARDLEADATSIIHAMFLTPGFKSEYCEQLLFSLDRHMQEVGDDTVSVLKGQYVMQRLFVYDLMTKTGVFSPDRKSGLTSGLYDDSVESIFAMFALGRLQQVKNPSEKPEPFSQSNYDKHTELIKNASRSTDWKREFGFTDEVFARNVSLASKTFSEKWTGTRDGKDHLWQGAELDMSNFYLASSLVLYNRSFVYDFTEARTKLHAMKALVALRQWQFKHEGKLPKSLEEVMQDSGYPVVPTDAFSNKSLLLAVLNGKPVIYSVGPNGLDEQAKVESPFIYDYFAKTTPMQSIGDFIFRIGK